jgi:hypothetical protein
MIATDILAVGAAGLREFGGLVANPLTWIVLVATAFAFAARPRVLRGSAVVAGGAASVPGVLAATGVPDAAAALAGGAAGGLLVAEVAHFFVVPAFKAMGILAGAAVQVAGLAIRNVATTRNDPPGPGGNAP